MATGLINIKYIGGIFISTNKIKKAICVLAISITLLGSNIYNVVAVEKSTTTLQTSQDEQTSQINKNNSQDNLNQVQQDTQVQQAAQTTQVKQDRNVQQVNNNTQQQVITQEQNNQQDSFQNQPQVLTNEYGGELETQEEQQQDKSVVIPSISPYESKLEQVLVAINDATFNLNNINSQLEEKEIINQQIDKSLEDKQEKIDDVLVKPIEQLIRSILIPGSCKNLSDIKITDNINGNVLSSMIGGIGSLIEYRKDLQGTINQIKSEKEQQESILNDSIAYITTLINNGPVPSLMYININKLIEYQDINNDIQKLQNYLKEKNSKEKDENYLKIINISGRIYNIDPLLLLAITGQEQSFIPSSMTMSDKIINNPWNVYHSWMEYQGGYALTSMIAASTVAKLATNCPTNLNIIKWVNGLDNDNNRTNPNYSYAEDPNWWIGVDKYYTQLKQLCNRDTNNNQNLSVVAQLPENGDIIP